MNVALHGSFDAMITLALTSYSMHMTIKALPAWTEWKYDIDPNNTSGVRHTTLGSVFFEQPLYKQCLTLYNVLRADRKLDAWHFFTCDNKLVDLACRWIWGSEYVTGVHDSENDVPVGCTLYWNYRGVLTLLSDEKFMLDPVGAEGPIPNFSVGLNDEFGFMLGISEYIMPIAQFLDYFRSLCSRLKLVPKQHSWKPHVSSDFFWELPDGPKETLVVEHTAKRRKLGRDTQTALIAAVLPEVAQHFMGIGPDTVEAVVVDLPEALWVPLEKETVYTPNICPISGREITIPARGQDCDHANCFDLPSFVQHARATSLWACPICKEDLRPPKTIVLDSKQLGDML